jgi:Excreted virulence factor EspC, type VII ESX diderm
VTAPVLKVDPAVLTNVGSAFGQAGDQLTGLHPAKPLSDAAASVPQLATAAACQATMADIATEMTSHADAARSFSENLNSAAGRYRSNNEAAAAALEGVSFP